MASAHKSKKRVTWRHALLTGIGVVAMTATFTAAGPTAAKADFDCKNGAGTINGANGFNILAPANQNGQDNGDSNGFQVCFGNVMLGKDNGSLTGVGGTN